MSVVIVGAGAAGLATAEALRQNGYSDPITVVGDEPGAPYDRPPLSKQVLAGSWTPERARLMSQRRLDAIGATFLLGRRAAAVDTSRRTVTLDNGASLTYDDLVLATGLRPRLPAPHLAGVHVLRTMPDALALRARLTPGAHLLVLGAGFLGLEIAATARRLGVDVTVVEPLTDPLSARLGATVAGLLIARHRSEGVDLRVGVGVRVMREHRGPVRTADSADTTGSVISQAAIEAVLTDGSEITADLALAAIGCIAELEWLAESGIAIDDGVVCDSSFSAGERVWAVGDVARWYHPRLERHVRVEHRSHANDSAQVVAHNILGRQRRYDAVPFFWTDHYDVKVQVAGTVPEGSDAHIVDGPDDHGGFIGRFGDASGPTAYIAWNAARRLAAHRRDLLVSAS